MRHTLLLLALVAALLCGCDCTDCGESAGSGASGEPGLEGERGDTANAKVVYDENGEPEGLHRHQRWSETIGQGAQPHGEIAFRNLAALGYKTILTVDGAVPQVELAARYGLRYVHVPIGYDGVPAEAAVKIVKAVRISEGPVYIHCHHGKHRGPAAAMIARIAVDGISTVDAVQALEDSGTSKNYSGLYRDVGAFTIPSADALAKIGPKDLPSKVVPQGVRAMMVDVSHRYDFLEASKKIGWKNLPDHPDISPAHEARMLWELYRESNRLEEAKRLGPAFLRFNRESEKAAVALEKALRSGSPEAADRAFTAVSNLCSSCHTSFRNK